MLAVSSMVHNRCQKTECSSLAVDNIVQSLKDTIGRCYVTDGNIKTVSCGEDGDGYSEIDARCIYNFLWIVNHIRYRH